MRYYVTADIHGYYTAFRSALESAGYFDDPEPHKLMIAGDLFDRGQEAEALQNFILELLERDEVILVRGNHEDLFEELITVDHGCAFSFHLDNGTYDTALQLTGFEKPRALVSALAFANAGQRTPYYETILPEMLDYYETEHYIITHGWIPCKEVGRGTYEYNPNWREASEDQWRKARWINGIDAARTAREDGKTIVCGHWHASYGHSKYEGRGSEFGADADFSPYRAPGILAIDACTAHSGIVNCVLLDDTPV